eukprot:scaffold62253_cov57-Phaeocystis_antarctica.AAC.1
MTSSTSFWPLKSATSVASLALAPLANCSSGSRVMPPPPPLPLSVAARSLEGRCVSATAATCVAAAAAAACRWRSITHLASVCASVHSPSNEQSRIALRRSLPLAVFGTERSRKTRT